MASTIYSALARMASSNARDFADQNRLGEYILLLASAFHAVLANLASINFCERPTLFLVEKWLNFHYEPPFCFPEVFPQCKGAMSTKRGVRCGRSRRYIDWERRCTKGSWVHLASKKNKNYTDIK